LEGARRVLDQVKGQAQVTTPSIPISFCISAQFVLDRDPSLKCMLLFVMGLQLVNSAAIHFHQMRLDLEYIIHTKTLDVVIQFFFLVKEDPK
jgi:hypothetical protein